MKTLRKLAERLSRGTILKRQVKVGGKTIPILVSPDAQLKYLKPGPKSFDQDLIKIAENYLQPSSNVWDIGANVGVFTFAAATIATQGTIVSIEADIWLANILRKTAQYKEYSTTNICVLPVAISSSNSVASFMIATRGRASNALEKAGGRSQMGGIREIQYVPTLTLDRLLDTFPAPDFVKIDIEGAELFAIQGAEKLINECRPDIYMEVGNDVSHEIMDIFTKAQYRIFSPQGEPLFNKCTSNAFFIPAEKC